MLQQNNIVDDKILIRLEKIQLHLTNSYLVSNPVSSRSNVNLLSPIFNVDQQYLRKTIYPVRYREFKDDFPQNVRKLLKETVYYLNNGNKLVNHEFHSKLLISISKTIVFDMFNKKLESLFRTIGNNSSNIRPYCIAIKALYARHYVSTTFECKSLLGRYDIDIIQGDKINQLLNVSKFILRSTPPTRTMETNSIHEVDALKFFFNKENLLNLFKKRDQLKINLLHQTISKIEGCPLDQIPNDSLEMALNKCSSIAVKVTIGHIEYKMVEELLFNNQDILNQPILFKLVLLDTLIKIQDDLGWIVSNRLISEDISLTLPFLISDLCLNLSTHTLTLVDSM